jgi:hypothetical protein
MSENPALCLPAGPITGLPTIMELTDTPRLPPCQIELGADFCGLGDRYHRSGGQSMNKITPFLWFNDNAEDAAEFYLSVFPQAKKVGELRSNGVDPWPAGKIATITIEVMGQQMTFLNGGAAQALTPAFSYSVACKDQSEIDSYWDKAA